MSPHACSFQESAWTVLTDPVPLSHSLDYIMCHFADCIHSISTTDALVLNYSEIIHAQEVLIPELLVLLVKKDMGVDNMRAREILEKSEKIGELVNSV